MLIKRMLHVFVFTPEFLSHKGFQVCTSTHRDYTFMHNSGNKLIQGTNGTLFSASSVPQARVRQFKGV